MAIELTTIGRSGLMLKHFHFFALLCCLWLLFSGCNGVDTKSQARLSISVDGKTDYVIVKPERSSAIDDYAIRELSGVLHQITDAEFKIVSADKIIPENKCIYVGISKPVSDRLGVNLLELLEDQEHVVKSFGKDVFLYGKGMHGNMHAVFEFIESQLGWRWYSVYDHPVITNNPDLILSPVSVKKGFSFPYRRMSFSRSNDFPYTHGINMGISEHISAGLKRFPDIYKPEDFAAYKSEICTIGSGHNLRMYIPSAPEYERGKRYEWLKGKYYFQTNPEYFSLWTNGKRVPNRQLCLSNVNLRGELTKNILRHIEIEGKGDEPVIILLGAMDDGGPFCCCPECNKLEEKYKSPGGPMYDYLLELCKVLAEKHPKAMLQSFAYRLSQTQIPPTLAHGKKLPKNFIIDFAPIEDAFFADWKNHKDKRTLRSYQDLKKWSKICDNLFAWQYPNPWGTGYYMPVCSVKRLIINMRVLHDLNVKGVFIDHFGVHHRSKFSELQRYLYFKLSKDINADTNAIIKEFTDNFYDQAAPVMRKYIDELEQCRIETKEFPDNLNFSAKDADMKTYPYLTVENIHRWQKMFDKMIEITADSSERVKQNIALARRELDFATLWKWFDLAKAYPVYYKDYTVCEKRIKTANKFDPVPDMNDGIMNRTEWEKEKGIEVNRKALPLASEFLESFITKIKCGGVEKPLPGLFKGIDKSLIRTFVPKHPISRGKTIIEDPDAPFGFGVPVAVPDKPFNFGFYQVDKKRHCARRTINKDEITPGIYKLYKLGVIDITADSIIWFSAKSWKTRLKVGKQLYLPGEDNKWEAYVSLKFDGPDYTGSIDEKLATLQERNDYADYVHGKKTKNLVLVGRIILVKKNSK